jgi:hypothetical protein
MLACVVDRPERVAATNNNKSIGFFLAQHKWPERQGKFWWLAAPAPATHTLLIAGYALSCRRTILQAH